MTQNNGLQYTPREVSSQGRFYEHASDCKVLVDHLVNASFNQTSFTDDSFTPYFIKIASVGDDSNAESERQLIDAATELGITHDTQFMEINKAYIELTLRSNGKADLYFHSYFIENYLRSLKAQSDPESTVEIFDINQYPFMSRIVGLSSTLSKVIVNIKKFPFHEKMYLKYVGEFGRRQTSKKMKYLEEIQRALFVAQIADDQDGLYWIEKLLIQLQGYCEMSIRDQAVVLLNMLYDGVDWQLQEAFRPVVRSVGQHFVINAHVHKSSVLKDSMIFLGLGAPSPIDGNNAHILTWHQLQQRNIQEIDNVEAKIEINFGKFWKCGFYDWRLVAISQDGKLQPLEIIGKPAPVFPTRGYDDDYDEEEANSALGSIAQGRFVVHSKGIRDQSFHEVQIDYQDAQIDKSLNMFVKRGTFEDVERNIPHYA